MRRLLARTGAVAMTLALGAMGSRAQEPKPAGQPAPAPENKLDIEAMMLRARGGGGDGGSPEKKFRDFADVTRGAEKIDGLFTLYRKDEHLYAEIKPFQFDQPLLAPIAIARGMAMAGQPLNFGDEWVLVFHRAGDRVQLVRRNIHYKASANGLEKAVKQAYTDSIIQALPIQAINQAAGQAVLIDFSEIFLGDFAQLGFGSPDRSRTSWHKVKAYPSNLELEVEATFGGGRFGFMSSRDDGVVDHRGITLVIHYSLVKMPDAGYRPRLADDRVGHFLSALKDFDQPSPDTTFVRQINRWRLEKATPKAKLSAPKKQIVWYIEDTVPLEYRPYVQEGILEWNKAFEKIGYKDAIAVRWVEAGRDEFDPEDINYCTFRWITSDQTYAMSGLRSNPVTGELIDGDVIFDASWIKEWKQEYAFLTGNAPPALRDGGDAGSIALAMPMPLAAGRVISPIMAAKQGFGLATPPPSALLGAADERPGSDLPRLIPANGDGLQALLARRLGRSQSTRCQFSSGMRAELSLAALALADGAVEKKDDDKKAEEKKADDKKAEDKKAEEKKKDEAKLPEELIGQGIKEVVMHEVGHSLGLRHNFKASTMLSGDQLHDTAITAVKGLAGSVMDYLPINVAPKGKPQGHYFSPTIGPYDYWAIEYAYKTADGDEAAELKKVAARAPDPDLTYATDEDMYSTRDPLVNAFDLGADTLRFAQDRTLLASQLLKDLDGRVVKDGESWARLRHAFSVLLMQWGNGSHLVSEYVGGQHVSRDHKGDKNGRDPVIPVSGVKQREALRFLVAEVFSDKAFHFPPALLRKLTTERWYHWGDEGMTGGGVEYPVLEEILSIQKIALGQCLDAGVLGRLQDQALQADDGAQPLTLAEVFRSLTDGIWTEYPAGAPPEAAATSTIRRNLQREHLRRLARMVLGPKRNGTSDLYGYVLFFNSRPVPPDAHSLARLHLKEIGGRIDKALDRKDAKVDDLTRAHLEECRHRIGQVLEARLDANEP